MCGIVGYMTNEGKNNIIQRDKFMRQALIVDTLRGKDSTGVYGVARDYGIDSTPGWLKQLGDGFSFVESEDYAEFEQYVYKYCVGHNRAATVGDVSVENAHPFQEGPITLVHNGSLWSTGLLPKTQKELEVEVDSHAICHNLAIADPEEVISRLDGAFALVWHDSRDDTLNIVRNSERPLHMAQVKGKETILFMSEAEMLYAVASRLNISLEDVVYPKPGQWLKFNTNDLLNPQIKQVDVSAYRSYYSTRGSYKNNYSYDDWWDQFDYDDKGVPAKSSNVVELRPNKEGSKSPRHRAPDENRIRVGGRWRPVPTRSQEMLLDLDYLVEQRLRFVPVSCSKAVGKQKSVVSGYAGVEGITGIVYGIKEEMYDRCKDRTWVVRPIGVKYMDDQEPALICRVVSTNSEYSLGKQTEEDESPFKETSYPESSEPSSVRTLKGRYGVYVTEDEYKDQIAGGCISCTGNISIYDADEIVWVNNDRDPMCGACVADYVERWGDAKD